jgi:glycosyltransferase involved in cell wall biosynthesis
LRDGQYILLADESQKFADAVARLLIDTDLRQRLARHGRELVEQRYSWQAVGRSLRGFLRDAQAPGEAASLAPVLDG